MFQRFLTLIPPHNIDSSGRTGISIVVGAGTHSVGGSKLRTAIERRLRSLGISFSCENRATFVLKS